MSDKYITTIWTVALICTTILIIQFTQCSMQINQNSTKIKIEAIKNKNDIALALTRNSL